MENKALATIGLAALLFIGWGFLTMNVEPPERPIPKPPKEEAD